MCCYLDVVIEIQNFSNDDTGNEGQNIHFYLDKIIDYAIHTPIEIACLIVS